MQSNECFHTKFINPKSFDVVNKRTQTHIESCPSCLSKLGKIESDDRLISNYLTSFEIRSETKNILQQEIEELMSSIEQKNKVKMIVNKKEESSRGRSIFFKNLFSMKSLNLLLFAVSSFIILKVIA